MRGARGLSLTLGLLREPASVGVARHVLDAALCAVEVDPACRDELMVALSEGCTNAVTHAAGADGYEVRLSFAGDRCVVDIVDAGRGVVRLPTDLSLPDPDSERGRGLSVMAMSTDSLQLTPRRPYGLAVRFTKRLV